MSIEHLFDSTVRVQRLTEVVDQYKSAVNRYVAQPDTLPCAIVPPKFRPSQTDAGAELHGIAEAYFSYGASVLMNDVLEVISGPEVGRFLRVVDVNHPRGHHTEARCEPFTDTITAAA